MSKFYFAWTDQGATFDAAVHAVEDENVFSFSISQEENAFAAMDVLIKNPKVGLLRTGRKIWAFLSVQSVAGGAVTPLFYGRLIGIPSNVFAETVTLQFTARPHDYVSQKKALANSLRVLPYWDPIFVSPEAWEDDDLVLEARSAVYHIDRVTHEVTISDVVNAEDGVFEFDEDQIFYESLDMSMAATPMTRVSVKATVPWNQTAQGEVDLTNLIYRRTALASQESGAPIKSYNIASIVSTWPKTGSKIGDWNVSYGEAVDVSATAKQDRFALPYSSVAGGNGTAGSLSLPEGSIFVARTIFYRYYGGGRLGSEPIGTNYFGIPLGYAVQSTKVSYDADRDFAETLTLTVDTDTQALMTPTGEEEPLVLTINANPVSDVTYDGSTPIVDARRRSYLTTDRGQHSIQHLALLARATLVARARAVTTSFEVAFDDGVDVTLRHAALIHDSRIPGGSAVGKVSKVSLALDGESGASQCVITIASTIGYGGAFTEEDGDPTWFEEGYVEHSYQEYENDVRLVASADLTYVKPTFTSFDDGLDLQFGMFDNKIVKVFSVTNNWKEVAAAVQEFTFDPFGAVEIGQPELDAFLANYPTEFSLGLVPLKGGPFVGTYAIETSRLLIPQQINLEA